MKNGPLALIILDGWGINPKREGNAIAMAHKPNWDRFITTYPSVAIPTSGEAVGLPPGQMGNSEVGHTNMGAGRVVYQDLVRINKAIYDGDFFTNPVLVEAMEGAKRRGGRLHLMGLVSDGGVHSMQEHLYALLEMAARLGVPQTYVQAITDGRDTPPTSGGRYLHELQKRLDAMSYGEVATIVGRYYAMDRDNRWERVELAYRAFVDGVAEHRAHSAGEAMEGAYMRGETDEFIKPIIVAPEGRLRSGDSVIFFNFRPDRAREITRTLTDPGFDAFERPNFPELQYVCLTQYDATFGLPLAFQPQSLDRILSPVLADAGVRQLRTAETEKYAHVTFFFNGGVEKPYPGEERVLVPSPKVATYDLQPEMSAFQVADVAEQWIKEAKTDVIIMNLANADMVGHTGDMKATVKAVEALDICLGRIIRAIEARGGTAIITADHGNAESMYDPASGEIMTSHTLNPVPLVLVGSDAKLRTGLLSDIAPTMLDILGIPQPKEMTG
ncbi:MAG TPA: 2,3-bisphosphoglycerate-independent phosphoglycerate mutase, partial [Pantanalinema sp.]